MKESFPSDSAVLQVDPKTMEEAICRAARDAVLAHARAGLPVATWQGGKVVWLSPEEILRLTLAPDQL
jgi:hypothetical protein